MPWKIIVTVRGVSTPEIFDIDDHDKRLVTFFGAGEPQEWATTVEDVEKQIWKEVRKIGAYTQVVESIGITIPLDKIMKIEISKS